MEGTWAESVICPNLSFFKSLLLLRFAEYRHYENLLFYLSRCFLRYCFPEEKKRSRLSKNKLNNKLYWMHGERYLRFIFCWAVSLYWFWVLLMLHLVILAILGLNKQYSGRLFKEIGLHISCSSLIICDWENQFEIYQDQMESGLFCTWTKPFFEHWEQTPGRFLFSLAELAAALSSAQLSSVQSDYKKNRV